MLLIASTYLDSMRTVNLYLKDDGTLAVNDSAKCELLNQYFASFTKDSGTHPSFSSHVQGRASLALRMTRCCGL